MPIDLSTYTGVDLIGDENRNEFRAAMMDIKATFHKTQVLYQLRIGFYSRFNEDRADTATYEDYLLDAFLEYSQLVEDKYIWSAEGASPEARIKVTFNVDYLDQMGLWDDAKNISILNGKEDRLYIAGREYRITEIPVYEGPIEARNVHTIIYAEPAETPTI